MSTTNGAVHTPPNRDEPSTELADQLLDVKVEHALKILVEPTWNVHRRVALLIAIIGRLGKNGHFQSSKSDYKFLEFDDLRDRINPLAYRCGIYLDYSQPEGDFTLFEGGKATSEAWVRAVNFDNPTDVTEWKKSKGYAYQNHASDDKTANKAQTQALKYATIKFLNISTGEPDGDETQRKDLNSTDASPASSASATNAAPTGGSHVLSQAQIAFLREGLKMSGKDEADFVRRNSKGFCSSLEDRRLQDCDVDRMVLELGYRRQNGRLVKINANDNSAAQPSDAPSSSESSTPLTAAASPTNPPGIQASTTKTASENQRGYIKSMLAESGASFAECCARAQRGPFTDPDDPTMKSADASKLIEVLKVLTSSAQETIRATQDGNRLAAQAAAMLGKLTDTHRKAILSEHHITIEQLASRPDVARSICAALAENQVNRKPREGFAAPAHAPGSAPAPIDTGSATIPAFAEDEPPF